MKNESERREFNRFPMKFLVEITAKDTLEKQFNEKTILKDISGGGAKFMTRKVDKYYPGQKLKMILYLPGTKNVDAYMKAKARVVRVDYSKELNINQKNEEKSIAVQFETLLNFERVI